VTISGTFDPSVANQKTTYVGGASATQNKLLNNAQGTSQVTFKGVEDLGGGLKASFLLENDFNSTTDAKSNWGNATNGGETYLGLEGGFGSLKAGAPNTPSLTSQASRQPIGTKIGSGFGGALGSSHVRENNSLVYATPTFAGFSAAVGYQFATKADTTALPSIAASVAKEKTDIGVNYANGPLRAGVSSYNQSGVNTQTNVYGQYDVAGATLYAGYHEENVKAAAANATAITAATTAAAATNYDLKPVGKSTGWNVAAKYALTPSVNLLANYAELNDKSASNIDREIAAVGAQYMLSKRTNVYARYVDEKISTTTAAKATGIKTTLVGVQHNF
jgi:predicted porin